MKLWSVVPARKGSVGVPDKNIRPLGDSSLVGKALDVAVALGGEVVITTDYDPSLIPIPSHSIILDRPQRLADHDASMWDVIADIAHKLRWGRADVIVLLQPTSLHADRVGIIKTILAERATLAVTVDRYPVKWHPWYALSPECHNHVPSSRHGLPPRFRPNGLAYIMSGCTARKGTFWHDAPKMYEVSGVLNIDTLADWTEAVRLYG